MRTNGASPPSTDSTREAVLLAHPAVPRHAGIFPRLLLLLAACAPSAGELDTVCTAYDEATARLLVLGDTVLVNAEARVQADRICDDLNLPAAQ